MNKKIAFCLVATFLVGCSTSSKDIKPADVSYQQFNTYSCEQLETELADLATQLERAAGERDADAETDVVIATVGIAIPFAYFWTGGTKEEEAAFSYLKGRYKAVERAATRKRCTPN